MWAYELPSCPPEQLIFGGTYLRVQAMVDRLGNASAAAWVAALDVLNHVRLDAVCALVERRLVAGRSLISLAVALPASALGLWQLLLSLPGYAVQTSLIFWPAGAVWWAVAGISSTQVSDRQVSMWDDAVSDWLRR